MFTAMGSFGVFAGLLLLINLFVMLAAERKSELGMLRAVGMRRGSLVGAFATEGFLYALAATSSALSWASGSAAHSSHCRRSAFSSEHSRLDLTFTVKNASLAQTFTISFVVAMLTIVVMSVRFSRLNIIRAIRDIAEPPPSAAGAGWSSERSGPLPSGSLDGDGDLVVRSLRSPPRPDPLLFGLAPAFGRLVPGRTASSAIAALTWSGARSSSRSSRARPRAPRSCCTSRRGW